jgi:pilus assembly protein CpaC
MDNGGNVRLMAQRMRWWFLACWLCAPLAMAGAAAPMLPERVTMYVGQALVKRTPHSVTRVAVGNGKLLEVKTIGTRQLVLIADSAGDTSLHLWMADGSQKDVPVHIVVGNSDQTAALVRGLLQGNDAISVNMVGGRVVLTGDKLSQAAMAHVAAIKKLYPNVLDFTSADAVQMRPMVMMKVRIMEFDKNSMNKLGIKWDSMIAGPSGGLVHDWATNSLYRLTSDAFQGVDASGGPVALPLRVSGTAGYFGIATSIASKINLMVQTGNAWELASPQLAARSGGKADFLVGGEVPIPVTQGLGAVNVQYKQYGIKLHIAPVVSADGNIAADVMTEVSHIDPTVMVNGYPGFLTRHAEAQVNVHAGQTIVISGLVNAKASKTFDKVPLLGDIPILGALFRSRDFRTNRTDLVIFVTPYVISAESPRNQALIRKSNRLRKDFRNEIGSEIVD